MATLIGTVIKEEYNLQPGSTSGLRGFKVQAASKTESIYSIIGASGVNYGSAHPDDPTLYALDFSASRLDDRNWHAWLVEAGYQNPDDQGTDYQLNPLLRDPEISYDTETTIFVAPGTVDQVTGTLTGVFANSAGEPYNPQPEQELEILVVNIQRNEDSNVSVQKFYDYAGAVNSDTFSIGDFSVGPRFAKLRPRIGRTQVWKNPATGALTSYRQVNYEIKLHPLGWDIVLADAGSYHLMMDGSMLIKKPFITNGNPH